MLELLTELEATAASLGRRALYGLTTDEIVDTLDLVTGLMARLATVQATLVREVGARGLPAELGHVSTIAWLRERFQMSPGSAKRLIQLGAHLDRRPALCDALATGTVNAEQAITIGATLDTLASKSDAEIVDKAEAALIDEAGRFHPAALATLGDRILSHVAPELADEQLAAKIARDEQRAAADRALTLTLDAGSGRTRLTGWLTIESAAILAAAIDPLAKPVAGVDGAHDTRTAPQRRADALVEVCKLALGTGDLPKSGGERPHLMVTVNYDMLTRTLGSGLLDSGQSLSPAAVRKLACDAQVIPAVLGSRSAVLDLGRSSRTWTGPARRAVVLRDGGCAFPACDRPPRWCDVHHIKFWALLGRTDLNNGVLLCGYHHQFVHNGQWLVRMGADGFPEFIPPAHVDPLQRPRRNHHHRRP